ncbi:MAG: adenylate/guanylate cyclase domain-containing protein, partial [Burkholderiales bacterium]
MDLNTVYIRTAKGEAELGNEQLSLELHDILSRVDGKTSIGQMMQDAAFWSEQTFEQALNELLEGGYVQMLSGTAIEEERAAPPDAVPREQEPPVEAVRSTGKSKFAESKRTLIASVLFLDIVEYTKHPVADQFRMKEDFNGLVYQLVQKIPEDDRIIIDTGDGAALGFLADPEEVLFIAIKLRDALEANDHQDYPDLYVRMGINLGPIKLVTDMNGRENLIGDGVNDASRIMGFAKGDQILISRSFHD